MPRFLQAAFRCRQVDNAGRDGTLTPLLPGESTYRFSDMRVANLAKLQIGPGIRVELGTPDLLIHNDGRVFLEGELTSYDPGVPPGP